MPSTSLSPSTSRPLRIAAFGFRSLPPRNGAAGADTFAKELYTRIVRQGHEVTAYRRSYPNDSPVTEREHLGISLVDLPTVSASGFDTLLHSFLCTVHIIAKNTGDVVHIHNGGNSIWAIPLRLAGKRVFVSQDGVDWKRNKWPWYARVFLWLSSFITARVPTDVIFDNVYARELFEKRFRRAFSFIPYGADFPKPSSDNALSKFGLHRGEYFLFVGRFIPDKGIHYLIDAYRTLETTKELVLVGGPPNPGSEYYHTIKSTDDRRIRFLGYVYGDEVNQIMAGAYCYVQPSDVEGLSPVLLTAMGLGKPIICSDIKENLYVVENTAMTFKQSDVDDLRRCLKESIEDPSRINALGKSAESRARKEFTWDATTRDHIKIFSRQ